MSHELKEAMMFRHSPTPETLTNITKEVISARDDWGYQDTGRLFLALVEEVGELSKALMEEPVDRQMEEAVQVAAMAIRIIENL